MSLDAMKLALDALEHVHLTGDTQAFDLCYADHVIPALRAAIEEAEKPWVKTYSEGKPHYTTPEASKQKPVAWKWKERVNDEFDSWVVTASEPPPYAIETHPLYTAPRQWQGLTDEDLDIRALWDVLAGMKNADGSIVVQFARAIEAKLKERNT